MKTRLLALFISFSFVPFLSLAQLPDMDFETWNTNTLYHEPDGLTTSNLSAFFINGQPNATEVSGSAGSAIRLETIAAGGDTLIGFVTNTSFGSVFGGGEPYSNQPDSVRITLRANHQPSDSSDIVLLFQGFGVPIGFEQLRFGGNISSFTSFTFPIGLPTIPAPDSLLVQAYSGAAPGSWLEIDEITFIGGNNQQINNNGFDNWSPLSYMDPEGWMSSNLLSALFKQPFAVRQNTTEVMSGTSSLEIENTVFAIFGGDSDTIGYISNSNIFIGGGSAGSGYTSKPEKLSLYYKYTPMGNDSATAAVLFSKWNSGTGETDSLTANVTRLGPAASFTKVELPINWTGLPDPDSVLIALAAGDLEGQSAQPGSVVIFDDLMFEFGVGIATPVPAFADQVHLYPNPAGDELFFDLSRTEIEEGNIRILNILGQPVFEKSFHATSSPIRADLSGWQSGTYLYEISGDHPTITGKFIVH